jgi:ribonucleoside-diphosphate reductase alpha chain
MMSMKVVKRNGQQEEVSFDKVLTRIQLAAKDLEVNPSLIAQRTLLRIYDGVKTTELDELAAQLSISLMTTNPDYGILASRIAISNHHRNTSDKFTEVVKELSHQVIEKTGEVVSNISEELVRLCELHGDVIDARIDYQRDYHLDYFGFKTLEKLQYLLRNTKGKTLERPQHLMMRVSLALWGSVDLERAFETYDLLSQKYFIHATPTNFNAGTPRQQLSSCFLLSMKGNDSIAGIYDTLKDCAMISKYAGGIGLHIHDIRAKGSLIRGTNGTSNGIVPMLRNFNDTARYVDQCFTPDTLVLTESGPQPIGAILPGEKVLTSEGIFHTVLKQVTHEYSGRMFRIQLEGHQESVQVTEEHPILSFPSDGQPLEHCLKQIHAGLKVVDYREVKELQVGDFTVFPHGQHGRIQSIEPVEHTGRVHDFEIDGPHDYTVAHLGIAHNGGGKRNGSFAIYLEPWHADVEDFLKLKLNTGSEEERCRDLFYALWVPDLFMERVEKNEPWTLFCPSEAPGLSDVYGDEFRALYLKYEQEGRGRKQVDAQKLWFRILDSQIETGTPYLLYKDACNQKSNQKNLGTIKSSNLCVAPETLILTDKGQFPIHTLVGQEVRVWNGEKWSLTTVQKTGEDQRLLTVHLSNGAQVTCTPYHKFITNSKTNTVKLPSGNYKYVYDSIKDAVRIDAKDLKIGQQLVKYELPVIEYGNENDIAFPYTHGFFCGDGTYHRNPSGYIAKGLSLYGEKQKLIPYLQIRSSSYTRDSKGKINTMLPDEIPEKYVVPFNTSMKCRLEWLAGLFDADGTCSYSKNSCSIQLGSAELEFLNNIRLLLTTMGVHSKIAKLRDETQREMPDGKGGHKMYTCKPFYRLLIASNGIHTLLQHGFQTHRLNIQNKEMEHPYERFIAVSAIVDEGRTDDTYCFNESENHAGVFNGICLGQCSEIIEYSSETEQAVCNLASIALPSYVSPKTRTFNFKKLREVVKVIIKNLNRVIDINFYPTPETKTSNMRHRPVGLGVQGLADVFALLRAPWESDKAAELNQLIFEHIYYAAVESSCEIAQEEGPYSTFQGSPMSQGLFQYDLWNVTPLTSAEGKIQWTTVSEEKDQTLPWADLKARVKAHGMRNSLLVAPMPTASTSQIMGFNEACETFTSNIYTRRTLAGEFVVINKYLMADLKKLDLWNEMMKQQIIARNGSVQGIDLIPESIQRLYKTSWEVKQKTIIDMAAARGAFICQSQSLNLFVADPNYAKLTSMHFYGWKRGLKTGVYYLRTRAPVMAQKFTIDPELQKAAAKSEMERVMRQNTSADTEECLMCGS